MDSTPEVRAYLEKLNVDLGENEKARNSKFFEDLLAEDLVFRRASRKIVGKLKFLEDLATSEFEKLETEIDTVEINGPDAVVEVIVRSKKKGQNKGEYRNIRVFRRSDQDRWQLKTWINTEIKNVR